MTKTKSLSRLRLFLVRHGETEWNRIGRFQGRNDQPLNERGRKQARALAEALQNENFKAIYTSPLPRSLETARCIRVFHPETPLIEEADFMEMDLGEFEGIEGRQWMEKNQAFVKAWAQNPSSVRMPGGESLEEVQMRALGALKAITALYAPGDTLLICSHNFVLLTLLCQALEIPLDRFREIRKGTASFSVVTLEGNRLQVEVINERSHLEKLPKDNS